MKEHSSKQGLLDGYWLSDAYASVKQRWNSAVANTTESEQERLFFAFFTAEKESAAQKQANNEWAFYSLLD